MGRFLLVYLTGFQVLEEAASVVGLVDRLLFLGSWHLLDRRCTVVWDGVPLDGLGLYLVSLSLLLVLIQILELCLTY